jgi:hypothetical protein
LVQEGGQMRKSWFSEEQIIGILREYEAGAKLAELCRRHNVSQTTIYKWRAKFGGMTVSAGCWWNAGAGVGAKVP